MKNFAAKYKTARQNHSDNQDNNIMKRILITDLCLIPVFLLTVFTGIRLHLAGHWGSHELWHYMATLHILAALPFTILIFFHFKTHLGWYSSLIHNGLGHKSRVSVAVSIVFVIVAMTGYLLLAVDGAGSGLGMWHYRIGLLSMVLFGGHIIKRLPVLAKTIKGHNGSKGK